MLARSTTALALCALLGACGNSNKSSENGFDQSFHEKFVASCVQSATASGVAQDLAGKICTCASDKVEQRFSVSEKMNLKQEQLRPIMAECKASIAG